MTPRQHAAAIAEYHAHDFLPLWYMGKHRLPLFRKEEIISTLQLALWRTCIKRQLNSESRKYTIGTNFVLQAKTEMKADYIRESRQYGIHARDIYKKTNLRNVYTASLDADQELENPQIHIEAAHDTLLEADTRQRWERLTDEQRQVVELKVDGLTSVQIAGVMNISRMRVTAVVAELKLLYGVTAHRKPNKPPQQSLQHEVSQLLGITEKAAKSRIFRLRKQLGLSGDTWAHRDTILEAIVI